MNLTVDFEADAGYLRLTDQAVARTVSWEGQGLNVDLDADGQTVGVEFLSLKDLKLVVGDVTFGPFSAASAPVTVNGSVPVLIGG